MANSVNLLRLEPGGARPKLASRLEFTAMNRGRIGNSAGSKVTVKEHGLKLTQEWSIDDPIGANVNTLANSQLFCWNGYEREPASETAHEWPQAR